MSEGLFWHDLDDGITCIDAGYVADGVACFYLLGAGDDYAVIETGTGRSVDRLLQVLASRSIAQEQLRYIIPTHVHLDHAGGAGAMAQCFPEAVVLAHPRGARHLTDPARLVASAREVYGDAHFDRLYGTVAPIAEARLRVVEDGERVLLGDRELVFRHTRGHADHHFCVWDSRSAGWFSGDMFGACYRWSRFDDAVYVLPTTTPTQFRPEAFLESIDLLASYSPHRLFLTHYR